MAFARKGYRDGKLKRRNAMTRILITLTLLSLYSAQSNAGILDDIMAWFSGEDESEVAPAITPTASSDVTSAVNTAASAALKAGAGLLPSVVQALGVTEDQAKGGLGAIFMAARATLSPEDYRLISDAVPDIDNYIAAAPPVNQLIGGAMNLLGSSAQSTSAANLVTQFNELGLGADMIKGFSGQAIDFIKAKSPEASARLKSVVSDYL